MFTTPKAFLGLAVVAMVGFNVPVVLAQRSSQADEQTIERRLLEQEAQKHGQSVEEFVYAIFEAAKLSDQEIDEIYTRNERRFRTQRESETVIKERIRQAMNRSRGRERYQSLLRELREKADVQIYLEEPELPRIDVSPDDDAFSAREITGRVYNVRTSQPIEGAELNIQVRSIIPSSPNPMTFSSRSDSKGQFQATIGHSGQQGSVFDQEAGIYSDKGRGSIPPVRFALEQGFWAPPGRFPAGYRKGRGHPGVDSRRKRPGLFGCSTSRRPATRARGLHSS